MNQQALIKKMRQLQNEMLATQKEIDETEFTSTCGPVTVVMYGTKNVKLVKIDEDFTVQDADDKELLEDSILAAMNQLSNEINDFTEEKMSKYRAFTGGF